MSKMIARRVAAGVLAASSLAGCYVVPVAPDGALVVPAAPARAVPVSLAAVLPARLYPANDVATRTGVVQGAVLDLRDGRGRFEVDIDGERLAGEATRVGADARRGVASAFGARGTSMHCEYALSAPRRGAGHCTLSSGARYQVHLGD